jgi:Mg-chelatase subunit ChlD
MAAVCGGLAYMRLLSLISILLACASCRVSAPAHRGLTVAVKSRIRADVQIRPAPAVRARAEIRANSKIPVDGAGQASSDMGTEADAGAAPYGPPDAEVGVEADLGGEAEVGLGAEAVSAHPVDLEGAEVVEFFGIPLDGAQDLIFVLDRSGSMSELAQGRIAQLGTGDGQAQAPSKIDVAHRELVAAIERLPAGTRLNVLYFNTDLEGFAAGMISLDDAGREELISFVKETFPSGRTALAPAMRTAFLMNARRIVLLSDGLGNVGGDSGSILRDAREAMRGGVRIDTIGIGGDQDAALLEALAGESGGLYQPL